MKKKFLLACMLITMAFSCVACGDNSDSDDNERSSRKEKEEDESDKKGYEDTGIDAFWGNLGLLDETEVYVEDEAVAAAVTAEADYYDEYGYYEEAVVETETVEATAENAEFNVRISNPVFFEQDGIKMTFLGFEDNYSKIRFQVDNNNPDNKKVDFEISGVRLNNIGGGDDTGYASIAMDEYDWDEQGLAGTSFIYTSGIDSYEYKEFNEYLNIPQESRKIYEMLFELDVRIGSDSEVITHSISIKTDDYIDNYASSYITDFKQLPQINAMTDISPNVQFSEKIMEEGDSYKYYFGESTIFEKFENFNIYLKQVEDGTIVLFKNDSNVDVFDFGQSLDSGSYIEYSEYVNVSVVVGDTVYYNTLLDMYECNAAKNGGMLAIKIDNNSLNYARKLEMSNDTAFSMFFNFYKEIDDTRIRYGYLGSLN